MTTTPVFKRPRFTRLDPAQRIAQRAAGTGEPILPLASLPAFVKNDPQAFSLARGLAQASGDGVVHFSAVHQLLAGAAPEGTATLLAAFSSYQSADESPRRSYVDLWFPTSVYLNQPVLRAAAPELMARNAAEPAPNLLGWSQLEQTLADPAVPVRTKLALGWAAAAMQEDYGPRREQQLAGGTRVIWFGDAHAPQPLSGLLAQGLTGIAREPALAKVISQMTVVVAPAGVNLFEWATGTAQPGATEIDPIGGFATEGLPQLGIDGPVLVLAPRYANQEAATAGHEILHLLQFALDRIEPFSAELDRAFAAERFFGNRPEDWGTNNSAEMFGYFGELYLQGFGPLISQRLPTLGALLERRIGRARIPPSMPVELAPQRLDGLIETFRSAPPPLGG